MTPPLHKRPRRAGQGRRHRDTHPGRDARMARREGGRLGRGAGRGLRRAAQQGTGDGRSHVCIGFVVCLVLLVVRILGRGGAGSFTMHGPSGRGERAALNCGVTVTLSDGFG